MEERLPQRTGKQENETLWEGEELAIRYLMEEGTSPTTLQEHRNAARRELFQCPNPAPVLCRQAELGPPNAS